MPKLPRLFLFLGFVLLPLVAPAQHTIIVEIPVDKNTISVRISANTPELTALAQQAFSAHGRYKVVASGGQYDFKFSLTAPTQVRVDISSLAKNGASTPIASEVAIGANARQALLRAADIAVVKTNGQGLKGFFSAKLAFIRDQGRVKEVCVSDLFFGDVKQITHDNALALTPRWAPDGSKILYTSYYKSGFPDIFQMDLGTYQRSTFASYRGTNSGAHFSPNGQHVAMIISGTGTPEVWVSDAQGHGAKQRTRSDEVKASPCFSPDSSRLVFAMEPGPQLNVMAAAGGAPQRLSTGFTYVTEPDWSMTKPNLIACTVRMPGGKFQIAVYDFSKGSAEVVSNAPFDGLGPSWLADGRHLVYTARTASQSRIVILDTETGRTMSLSPASFGNASEASVWNP